METVTERSSFTERDLDLLASLRPLAEELVGEHFQITSFGPQHHLYEIVTLDSCGPESRAPRALAKLCRFDREERVIDRAPRASRFYRICLQDDNILERVSDGYELRALLLYVLTHELIHIVRFESFAVIYDAGEAEREAEEQIVDELTWRILSELKDPEVKAVVEDLSARRVDVLSPGE